MPENRPGKDPPAKTLIHVEDGLILVSIGLLFWLGVLKRHQTWAQVAMIPVLAMMVVVLIHRLGRLRRAMQGRR